MYNNNGQLPPDIPVDIVVPQTTTNEVASKPAFDTRNYLDFSIPAGQKSREIWIRLLPVNPETQELFKIIKLHSIPVNKELKPNKSGRKSYLCLKQNDIDHDMYGYKCPICEEQKKLWDSWHQETNPEKKKEIAKAAGSLDTRDYCIVRCIERGKEEDGPKFWRIPLRQDQTDAYHTIVALGETRRQEGLESGQDINIFSIYNGRDLKITFTDGTGAPTVMDKSVSTPLTKDNDLLVKWVSKTEADDNKSVQEISDNNAIAQAEARFTNTQPVYTTSVPSQPTITVVDTPTFTSNDDDLPF